MSHFDPIRFNRILAAHTSAEIAELRKQVVEIAGSESLNRVEALVRPRLLQLQESTRGDAIDWGAIECDREPGEPGSLILPEVDRPALEHLSVTLTLLFCSALRWWSRATDVPVGLENIWWIATSVLEAADHLDPEDLEPLEDHLWGLARRCEMIDAGHFGEMILDITSLVHYQLEDVALETAEDLAQLLLPMGGTRLLQALVAT